MKPKEKNRFQNRASGLGLVQSDLAMNIFVVFLVVLSVLTISSAIVAIDGFRLAVKPESSEQPMGAVRSWNPVIRPNQKFLVRNGILYRLNLENLAKSVAAGQKLFSSDSFEDATALLPNDLDPSAYRLYFYLYVEDFPANAVSYSVGIDRLTSNVSGKFNIPDEMAEDLASFASFDIFYHATDSKDAWVVMEILQRENKTYRLVTQPSKKAFLFTRSTANQAFEETYK